MSLIREFVALTRSMLGLWARYLPRIGTWLLLSWLLYSLCLLTSALIGTTWAPLGAIVFVVGVTFNVLGVIFAIHELKPGVRSIRQLRERGRGELEHIPEPVFADERRVDVAVLTIGPVLAVYAVWGLIDGMIRDGFLWNSVIRTMWNATEWSISRHSDRFWTYLWMGVVALVGRMVWARLFRNRRSPWWRVPVIFLEGLWTFATFFIILIGADQAAVWVRQRRFWRDGETAWNKFLDWLPEIHLPFDLTLPEALRQLTIWLSESVLPGLWGGIALPLMWLAIVAIVFGWREFRARDLLGQHVRARTELLEKAHGDFMATLGRLFTVVTADLRDKYLPLVYAFRLIWKSGPYVLGSYLVLTTLVNWGVDELHVALFSVFAVDTEANVLRSFIWLEAVREFVALSLLTCLYAASFDRGLADASGLVEQGRDTEWAAPDPSLRLDPDTAPRR
ncbi:hypothetical protein GCM10028820_13170 [Tessaracoccus terricola]